MRIIRIVAIGFANIKSPGWKCITHLTCMILLKDGYQSLTFRDVKAFGNKILNTNSKGFRGKKDSPYTKNKEKLRILILGDSFTFGDEVSDDETYSYYLQEMLPNTEVINMGVHGYGHDQMLILLKEEGVKYAPDIVILGFLALDMSRNLLEFRDYAKPRFFLQGGELKLTGTPVPRPEEILKWDWTRPKIVDLFSLVQHRVKKFSGIQQKEMETITTALLTDMIHTIESIPAIPILAYLPRAREIAKAVPVTQDEEYLFSICKLNPNAQCFSTRPYFAEKIAKGETFKSSGHWEPAGHLAVAEAIKRYLIDQGYVAIPSPSGGKPSYGCPHPPCLPLRQQIHAAELPLQDPQSP